MQLTIEALFLEGTARLVGAAPGMLSTQQGADLEAVAFDWLLGADAYLSFPDPYRHKDRVRLQCRLCSGHPAACRQSLSGQTVGNGCCVGLGAACRLPLCPHLLLRLWAPPPGSLAFCSLYAAGCASCC